MTPKFEEIPITDIVEFRIGHAHDLTAATGCTAIICSQGAVAGVDVRGGAPGTRETDALKPENLVERIHAVMLSGGSAFGLEAACGITNFLEARNIGFDVDVTKVPIVAGAVLFDLRIGDAARRPDKAMGYEAAENAFSTKPLEQGCVGAGTGATVGKLLGPETAMKSGIGCYCIKWKDLKVGAIVAVNCLGDVIDPETGRILAGLLCAEKNAFASTEKMMMELMEKNSNLFAGNTTIGAILTNADLTKSQAKKLASMAHNGYARTLRPAHSMFDGDTIFALACGNIQVDLSALGIMAVTAMEKAVIRSVRHASSLHGYPSSTDILKNNS